MADGKAPKEMRMIVSRKCYPVFIEQVMAGGKSFYNTQLGQPSKEPGPRKSKGDTRIHAK